MPPIKCYRGKIMPIKLHNTLTRQTEDFIPISAGKVQIYSCGPTVYDYPHIGNWASYIYWDTLVRILTHEGFEVNRVMNITDVGHLVSDGDEGEDKIEKGALREGKTAWEIAKFYSDDFIAGMKDLNLIEPQHLPHATDYINEQLDLIRQLKNNGVTYQTSDGIYFDTSKFHTYAKFAHLDLDAQKAGARVEINTEKRNPWDFALWKFTPLGQKRDMEWETPADVLDNPNRTAIVLSDHLQPESDETPGLLPDAARSRVAENDSGTGVPIMGFPGWHLECSAIAMKFLGETIDIHTGGIDHIPVHHTNEIAQSEAASGKRFANYWLHNNFLKVDGTKISKSLGNGYSLADLKKHGFSSMDFRMFILQGHYRSEGNFTYESLTAAQNRLHNWRNITALRHQIHDTIHSEQEQGADEKTFSPYATSQAIAETIENDLGTPEALKIVDEAFSQIESLGLNRINRRALVELLEKIDELLGLELINSTPDISDEAKKLILERKQARVNKEWDKSDHLRAELKKQSVEVKDSTNDTIWQYS